MPRCPFAIWTPISGPSGDHLGGPFKIVHHTTEGSTAEGAMDAFRTNRSDPHFTVDANTIFQHVDTDAGARALRNAAGGVQTNRDSAVQIELVGFAHLPKNRQALTNVARLCRWIEATHGVPSVWPSGPPRPARNGKDPGGHNRDALAWDQQSGHFGHSHVPENTHWDPGYTASEAEFVLTATFDGQGRLTSPALAAPAVTRGVQHGAARAATPRSTMPDHHEVGEPVRGRRVARAAKMRRMQSRGVTAKRAKSAAARAASKKASKSSAKARQSAAAFGGDAQGATRQGAPRRPRICFERIIPDALDPERHVRRALRGEMIAASGRKLNANEVAGVARMALVASKRWGPGSVVRCRFLDGSAKMQAKVRHASKGWESYANVTLKFVSSGAAEIRISFYADEGSWSAVGRDALNTSYFPPHQPTMNFGWVRDDSDPIEDRAVILHEFGHALGCIHEHQSPTFDRKWDRAAVMRYFQGPPNYWSPADIEANVLKKYSPTGVKATTFDPKSIMLYQFDAGLFSDGKGATNENSQLSAVDRTMIGKMYPR